MFFFFRHIFHFLLQTTVESGLDTFRQGSRKTKHLLILIHHTYFCLSFLIIRLAPSLSLHNLPLAQPHPPSLLPSRHDERRRLKWLQSIVISGCRCFSEGSASKFYYWGSEWVRFGCVGVGWGGVGGNYSLLPSLLFSASPSITEMRSRRPVVADCLQSNHFVLFFGYNWFVHSQKSLFTRLQNEISPNIKHMMQQFNICILVLLMFHSFWLLQPNKPVEDSDSAELKLFYEEK